MTKVSYEKVLEFRNVATHYTNANMGKFSPFLYAVGKMLRVTKKIAEEYSDRETFLNVDFADKDTKGFAAMEKFTRKGPDGKEIEEERYRYTAAKSKELHKAKRELLQEEVDVECYETEGKNMLEYVPDTMDFHRWQIFAPFVLPEEPSPEVLEKLIERSSKPK